MKGWGLIGLAAGLLLLSASAFGDENNDKVDRLFERWNRPDSPGGAIAVIRDGKVLHLKGYGMADLEHGIANAPHTVFNAGSLAKQFTAFAIALLEANGQLNGEDDVRKHVPELPDFGKQITIHDLIHHSSGLRDYAMLIYLGGWPRDEYHSAAEVIASVLARQQALNFSPGERYEYSNSNYLLLGEIVRRVSGMSLREFCSKYIFTPLGMTHSLFNDDAGRIIKDRALGHLQGDGGSFRQYRDNNELVGDGGLYVSPADLCIWERNFHAPALGGPEISRKITSRGDLHGGEQSDYAYGLEHGHYKGLPIIRHSGSYIGFGGMLVRFPLQKLSVVCLSNCDSLDTRPMALRVARIYLGDLARDEKPVMQLVVVPEAQIAEKSGAYRSPANMDLLLISARDGRLFCDTNYSGAVTYAPVGASEFKAVQPDMPLFLRFMKTKGKDRAAVQTLFNEQLTNTYEPVELDEPADPDLSQYAGDYFSEELQAQYSMVTEEGHLYVRFRRAPQRSPRSFLRPTITDEFAAWPLIFQFFRDRAGKISGFKLAPIGSEHISFFKTKAK